MPRRIGILGGTFDPVHYGHLAIAEEAGWVLRLESIYLVPAAQQPLKPGQHHANPHQRLEMVRLACANNSRFIPSDLDLQRDPPSYTIDTLRAFRSIVGSEADLWFIIGGDSLVDFPKWHAAAAIITLAHLAVVQRPGVQIDLNQLEAAIPGITERTTLIESVFLPISSTDLRQRLAQRRPVRYQMPDNVLDYITEQGLYRQG